MNTTTTMVNKDPNNEHTVREIVFGNTTKVLFDEETLLEMEVKSKTESEIK